MSETLYDYETGKCAICGEVTFKYKVIEFTNDNDEVTGTGTGDVVDYGKCKVAETSEIPNHLNEVEQMQCPFYRDNFLG